MAWLHKRDTQDQGLQWRSRQTAVGADAAAWEGRLGPFEHLLLFAAVILGLAVSDLAVSTHRLLNAAASGPMGRRAATGGRPRL